MSCPAPSSTAGQTERRRGQGDAWPLCLLFVQGNFAGWVCNRLVLCPHLAAGSLLSPSPDAAVVGGNVLTSQRVTDVVLKAFNAAAASQVRQQVADPGMPAAV